VSFTRPFILTVIRHEGRNANQGGLNEQTHSGAGRSDPFNLSLCRQIRQILRSRKRNQHAGDDVADRHEVD
jgi:hypothetical protein